MFTSKLIHQKANSVFVELGYKAIDPVGLINQIFPDFNPSSGHVQLMNATQNTLSPPSISKFFVDEYCFRNVDVQRVGDCKHLSLISMITAFASNSTTSKSDILTELYRFLVEIWELKKERLLLIVSGGITLNGEKFGPDVETIEILKDLGFTSQQVIELASEETFILPSLDHQMDFSGPRCEIYYRIGKEEGEEIIEVASFGHLTHRGKVTSGGHIKVEPLKEHIFGYVFGTERLIMAINRHSSIYEIEEVLCLIERIKSEFHTTTLQKVFSREVDIIADRVRALVFLYAAGGKVEKSRRGEIIKRLIRDLTRNAKLLEIDRISFYEELIDMVIKTHQSLVPYMDLKGGKEELLNTIRERG